MTTEPTMQLIQVCICLFAMAPSSSIVHCFFILFFFPTKDEKESSAYKRCVYLFRGNTYGDGCPVKANRKPNTPIRCLIDNDPYFNIGLVFVGHRMYFQLLPHPNNNLALKSLLVVKYILAISTNMCGSFCSFLIFTCERLRVVSQGIPTTTYN